MTDLVAQVDALLPQTQCGQCGYAGCLPYAKAMVEQGAALDRCPPGGGKTLLALGKLLNKEVSDLLTAMAQREQPIQIARVKEDECIGCVKCIRACPVDAILGSAKQLHTILASECTGCGLCVTPCPVDCIEMMPIEHLRYQPEVAKRRFYAQQARLLNKQQTAVVTRKVLSNLEPMDKKAYIAAARRRVQAKRARLTSTLAK